MKMKPHLIRRKLAKPYSFRWKLAGVFEKFTVPAGTLASNRTARGLDMANKYWFVSQFDWVPKLKMGEEEIPHSLAIHNFQHYGINVPEGFLEDSNIE